MFVDSIFWNKGGHDPHLGCVGGGVGLLCIFSPLLCFLGWTNGDSSSSSMGSGARIGGLSSV